MPKQASKLRQKGSLNKFVMHDFIQRGPNFSIAEKVILNTTGYKMYLEQNLATARNTIII